MTHSFTPIVPPVPSLTDGVITLRLWTPDDVADVHAAVLDREIPRFTAIPANHTLEGVERWVNSRGEAMASGEDASFAVVDARTGELLGSAGVERSFDDPAIGETGYWVVASARGRGVATRAVRLITDWAFDAMSLERLQITTHEENAASRAVAEKCGFRCEGTLRGYREQHGARVDVVMYGLLASDVAEGRE